MAAAPEKVLHQVFFPTSFTELFTAWGRFPDAVPYAGGSELIRCQERRVPILPGNILSLNRLGELHHMSRTERYLEIGAMVTLNAIIRLGKIVPEILSLCLEGIGGPQVRNTATIGGSLCSSRCLLDAAAAMIALDAHYELKTASQTRWISAARFSSLPNPPAIAPQELLTRIRIPLEQWNFSFYRKFHTRGKNEAGGAAVFILNTQKNILRDLRIVFAGGMIVRERNAETLLAGKGLPLDKRDVGAFMEHWKAYLSGIGDTATGGEGPGAEMIKAQILNFIEASILGFAE
jgi:CO/xanthine dehydrogenase FAD-binding subunit